MLSLFGGNYLLSFYVIEFLQIILYNRGNRCLIGYIQHNDIYKVINSVFFICENDTILFLKQ